MHQLFLILYRHEYIAKDVLDIMSYWGYAGQGAPTWRGLHLVLAAVPSAVVHAIPHALAGMVSAAHNTLWQRGAHTPRWRRARLASRGEHLWHESTTIHTLP